MLRTQGQLDGCRLFVEAPSRTQKSGCGKPRRLTKSGSGRNTRDRRVAHLEMRGDNWDFCDASRALEVVVMADLNQITRVRSILRAELPSLSERYGVASLGLFGSMARGDAHPGSDVDILVRFDHVPGLLRFIELENYLTDLLAARVDLVMVDALKPHIRRRIMAEVVAV